jgi:predicted  nucleic acid-binding Zn-ribbon protein
MLHDRTAAPLGGSREPDPSVELLQVRFERDVALAAQGRLEKELRRLERRLAELESERSALRTRLEERERYLAAIRSSLPWRVIQLLRGLVGRRW